MGDLIPAANDVIGAEVGVIAEWIAVEFHSNACWFT
jgi:hypothetical protein